jgi:hypothetical protein
VSQLYTHECFQFHEERKGGELLGRAMTSWAFGLEACLDQADGTDITVIVGVIGERESRNGRSGGMELRT